jgi:hypothetical protein
MSVDLNTKLMDVVRGGNVSLGSLKLNADKGRP